ncbi:Subunit of the NuA3 histone acetyltransferase complex [Golovinomyces cichoracearum]|uniref:Subunit of the NuA3 histone acetyltransferase complex n=1 Tax=Golovinomyces cichoracearum TaxID=62708 RepID=A0A420IE53_9PEZI|nr:Subunit of the NuA3 histone acetyltransferase complex [Golovinomyces cichoracearum]
MGLISDKSPRSSAPRSMRPKSSGADLNNSNLANKSSEPAFKKRKYVPGGPGGGGRYFDEDGTEILAGRIRSGGHNSASSRRRAGRQNNAISSISGIYDQNNRCTRNRSRVPRSQTSSLRYSSAAQAAAVVQSDGYKPREERAWEEFHPNLDIDIPLLALSASEVEGQHESGSEKVFTSSQPGERHSSAGIEVSTPFDKASGHLPLNMIDISSLRIPGTPGGGKRRPGRPPKDPIAFFAAKAAKMGKSFYNKSKTPNNLPPVPTFKEKLTLPQPSYRKTNTLARFEDKTLGHARLIDESMARVGYQESKKFLRPHRTLIKVSDVNLEDDLEYGPGCKGDCERKALAGKCEIGRVEYDMDEQDDKWLDSYNAARRLADMEIIQREIFEITITKIEKEWHNLEKKIPKPNPKPPQTHRPRSSSAAAVNGEAQSGEEQDSKCAICDDGDCENTNAIVFCDGCDLAVHQECYGVPFIPEGQWLCRKCQLIGRGVPTCIFCPNTDGAFKQTNASKWAHLLCAMWIPEVSLGNHTFMEPIMEVEKVPKTRWKLSCYLCNQRMGACIQCGNKSCYQAFHVTCARRARLFLKMKNCQGTLSVLDGSTNMKAFCDKHCPTEWLKENDVANATRDARAYFKKTMRGKLWADSQASASEMAANYHQLTAEHQSEESQAAGNKMEPTLDQNKNKGTQVKKPIWKLPSGAPVIPFYVYQRVQNALARFDIQKCKEYIADVCRYWTLKREARRGAALLKRLQLQMETFSSNEITRRNFAGMGQTGRPKLQRRIEFAKILMKDIENLKSLSENVVKRELKKLEAAKLQVDFVDTVYFPVAMLFTPILENAKALNAKGLVTEEFTQFQRKIQHRHYTSVIPFTRELCRILRKLVKLDSESRITTANTSVEITVEKIKESHELVKRVITTIIQPKIESAARIESEICGKLLDDILRELSIFFDSIWHTEPKPITIRPNLTGKDEKCLRISDSIHSEDYNSLNFETQKKLMNPESFEPENCNNTTTDIRDDENFSMVRADLDPELEDKMMIDFDAKSRDSCADSHEKLDIPRDTSVTPDKSGYQIPLRNSHPAPPTPPKSTDECGFVVQDDVLSNGGIPFIFKNFEVKGTTCLDITDSCSLSEHPSDLDNELAVLEGHPNEQYELKVSITPTKGNSSRLDHKRGHG